MIAVLVSGFYLTRSTEAAVTKEAITKATKGDFGLLSKQARTANDLVVAPVGAQQLFLTQTSESQYRKQYPWLDSRHVLSITAPADKDIYIHYFIPQLSLNGVDNTALPGYDWKIASSTAQKLPIIFDGVEIPSWVLYLIPKGQTRSFQMEGRFDTGVLFKGIYSSYISSFVYSYDREFYFSSPMNVLNQGVSGGYARTNTVSVLGEKSPYIKTFNDKIPVGPGMVTSDVYPGQVVSIKGPETMASDVHLDGKITTAGEFQKINGPTEIKETRYVIPYNLPLGVHNIYLNSVIFGKSNTVWFRVVNRPITPPCTLTREILTVGTVDAVQVPILSRYLNRVTGSTLNTSGTVFTEAVKAALIKEQSVARAYPIYVNLNYYNRAWINGRLTVADCGTTTEPSITARLVQTSTEIVDPADSQGEGDRAEFEIVFDVTAVGGDIYLDGDYSSTSDDGLRFKLETSGPTYRNTVISLSSATTNPSDKMIVGDRSYKIANGETRRFTLTSAIEASGDITARLQLLSLAWDIDNGDNHSKRYTPVPIFETNPLFLNYNASVAQPSVGFIESSSIIENGNGALYKIKFRMNPGSTEALYLDKDCRQGSATSTGANYFEIEKNGGGNAQGSVACSLSTTSTSTTLGVNTYRMLYGLPPAYFDLVVSFSPTQQGIYRLKMKNFGYAASDIDSNLVYNENLNSFVTPWQTVNPNGVAQRQGLMASTWEAFQSFLVRIAVGK